MPHIEIAAEKIISIFGFPITNTLITSWIVVAIIILFSQILSRKISKIPSMLQNVFEFISEKLIDLLEGIFGSREKAEKYFPIVTTIFIFILISNWLGIFPGVGSIGFFEQHGEEEKFIPLFRSAASDLNFTLALAILAILFVNGLGMVELGFWKHLGKFFSLKSPIAFFVGILEFLSEFARMIAFTFRLFGNVFAGEVLLVITSFLVPYAVPVPFLILELFVGFIQALVFAMLTAVFISMSVSHNEAH